MRQTHTNWGLLAAQHISMPAGAVDSHPTFFAVNHQLHNFASMFSSTGQVYPRQCVCIDKPRSSAHATTSAGLQPDFPLLMSSCPRANQAAQGSLSPVFKEPCFPPGLHQTWELRFSDWPHQPCWTGVARAAFHLTMIMPAQTTTGLHGAVVVPQICTCSI